MRNIVHEKAHSAHFQYRWAIKKPIAILRVQSWGSSQNYRTDHIITIILQTAHKIATLGWQPVLSNSSASNLLLKLLMDW